MRPSEWAISDQKDDKLVGLYHVFHGIESKLRHGCSPFYVTSIGTTPIVSRQATMFANGFPNFLTAPTFELDLDKIDQLNRNFG